MEEILDFEELLINDLEDALKDIEYYLKKLKREKKGLIWLKNKTIHIIREYEMIKGEKRKK